MSGPFSNQALRLAGCARILVALGSALFVGACESGGSLGSPADGGSAPIAPTIPYRLAVADPGPGAEAALQREILGAVRAALAAKGMYEAPRGAPVDLTVRLDYRVGQPHDGPVSESVPIYEITRGKMVDQSVIVGIGATGGTIYEMRKVKEPDIETYLGERPVTIIRKVYEKRLHLSARENRVGPDGQLDREVWSLELIAVGQSRDLKRLLPVLAGPGRPFLGSEADGPTVLRINEDKGTIDSVERVL